MRNIIDEIKKKVLLIDGGMGSLLQKNGVLKKGMSPESINIDNEEAIKEIHINYLKSGADIITTNSFGANHFKLKEYGLEKKVYEINKKAAEIARECAGNDRFVAGSIGPTGKFIKTEGDLSLDEAIKVFSEQAKGLCDGGVDVFIVETMFDLWELKAAVMGIKSVSDKPIIAHLTYQQNGRTLTGTDPASHVVTMEALDVFCIGSNCSLGAKEMLPVIKDICKYSEVNVSAAPNAGLPVLVDGKTVFPMKPEEFALYAERLIKMGVNIIGGCCGTEYDHIKACRDVIDKNERVKREVKKGFCVASRSKSVILNDKGFFLIGERLNPTARKKLSNAVIERNWKLYIDEAISQEMNGADVIDINVGVPKVNEVHLLSEGLGFVQGSVETPISIDSSEPKAIINALKIADGKPLVNSVNGKQKVMDSLFPYIKKYGAATIVLLIDEEGIPDTIEKRIEILDKIILNAEKYGVKKENLLIDCLSLAVAAEKHGPNQAMETIRIITEKYGLATTMGISNVSYGLPMRKYINSAFLIMCMANGLKSCIGNPNSPTYMAALMSTKFLMQMDQDGKDFLKFSETFKEKKVLKNKNEKMEKINENSKIDDPVYNSILNGIGNDIENLINSKLENEKPMTIIKKYLIPAIEEVGKRYDSQQYYLPQLISGADVMKKAFDVIKPHIVNSDEKEEKLGKIILATVEGDVHDIGKNIVKIMLENFGFEVIDLGKDVKTEFLIEKLKQEKPDILGLSALMTTTMGEMENIVKKIKEECIEVKVMVGGAVVTLDYCNKIGADAFGADAMHAVSEAKRLVGENGDKI